MVRDGVRERDQSKRCAVYVGTLFLLTDKQ